ncbi:MAG: DUF1636 domain-containing protein [Pseudomonadota bacterium]|nr:DUF1636 domain-containing protein [Pseudomonadota bacterium]
MQQAEPIDLHICVTCRDNADGRPGEHLYNAMNERPCAVPVRLHRVECLSVCKRPCTIAVSSPSKWTYVIAGIEPSHAAELCNYLDAYAASPHGTPPLKDRPPAIRAGTIARIPPRG